MAEYTYTYQTFPMPDSGIGIEMGYESDAAFLAARDAEEAELDPEVREALQALRKATHRAMFFGGV